MGKNTNRNSMMSGAAIAATVALAGALRAQTTAARPSPTASPPHMHLKLRSRELPPSGGGPFAALPNFAATALTLRHWRQPEVTFHVTPARDDSRTPDQVRALAAQGVALWRDKIGGKLTLRMVDDADAAEADVEIGFVPAGGLPGGRIGETDIRFTSAQDIHQAQIQLVEGLSEAQLVQAIAHESGHALGIQGHSDDKHDLMYPQAHLPAAITDRDANTMNIAYYQIDTSKKERGFKRGEKLESARSY